MPYFPSSGGGAPLGPGGSDAAPGTIMANGAILYVNRAGVDTNNGLSWKYAFKTVKKAIQTANILGGATIWVQSGSWPTDDVDTDPTKGPGLWIHGSYDLGVGGTGWLLATSAIIINIIPDTPTQFGWPVGQLSPGGGRANLSGPALQICGVQTMVAVNNLLGDVGGGAFPAYRIGLSSPLAVYDPAHTYSTGDCVTYLNISYQSKVNSNVGHQPNTSTAQWDRLRIGIDDGLACSLTANYAIDKCYFTANNDALYPTCDSAYAFFGDYGDNAFVKLGAVDATSSNNAAFRMVSDVGSNVATYLTNFNGRTIVSGGGIWSIGANNNMVISNIFGENMVTKSFVAQSNAQGGSFAIALGNITQGDSSQPYTFDTTQNDDGFITATGALGEGLGRIFYSNHAEFNLVGQGQAQGQYGTSGSLSLLQQDSARRRSGPAACPYPNVASHVAEYAGNPVTAHDGLANGARDLGGFIFRNTANATLAAGDRLAFGAWVRFTGTDPTATGIDISNGGAAGTQVIYMGGPNGHAGRNVSLGPGDYVSWFPQQPIARYKWAYLSGWFKVVSVAGDLSLRVECNPGSGMADVEEFWAVVIPASDTRSDSEVAELAMNVGPTPNYFVGGTQYSPTAGYPALRKGQKLAFWDEGATPNKWAYINVVNGIVTVS
jgi:hypothetical protein